MVDDGRKEGDLSDKNNVNDGDYDYIFQNVYFWLEYMKSELRKCFIQNFDLF